MAYDFSLVGYKTNEIDTVIFRAYKADNTFGALVASSIIVDTIYTASVFDTFRVWGPLGDYGKDTLFSGGAALWGLHAFEIDTSYVAYDWEVYLPSVHRTYYIHGITITGSIQQNFDACKANNTPTATTPTCAQHMSSYYLDGQQYPFKHQDGQGDYIFLAK